jgi:hypothetical protein
MTRQHDFVASLGEPHQFNQLPLGVGHDMRMRISSASFGENRSSNGPIQRVPKPLALGIKLRLIRK